MTQTLAVVVLFVVAISFLPWLVRRLQLRQAGLGGGHLGRSGGHRLVGFTGVDTQQHIALAYPGARIHPGLEHPPLDLGGHHGLPVATTWHKPPVRVAANGPVRRRPWR